MTETQTPERRKLDTIVTSENLAEYQNQKLGITEAVTPAPEEKKEEVEEHEEPIKVDAEEDPIDDDNKKVLKKTNSKIEKRFSELTQQRKEAQARAEAAERRAAELEAKLKPVEPVKVEAKGKPQQSDYTDAFKYAEDLSEWRTNEVLRERDESEKKTKQAAEQQQLFDTWNERLNATRLEIPDFDEKMSTSSVTISNEVRDAILESDIGPKILLHLAENPDEASRIGKLTVGRAMVALGKIEAKLTQEPVKKEEKKTEKEPEVSKAPAPISPLKGASSPVDLPINGKGEWTGTHEQYKEARRTGKIK